MYSIFKYVSIAMCVLSLSCALQLQRIYDIKFRDQVCLTPHKEHVFKTCASMAVYVNDKTYVIPAGFETDLASIPRLLWSLYAPNDSETVSAAILHDWLYCCVKNITRKEADLIFYQALIDNNAGYYKAFKYYIAVRVFGKSAFTYGTGKENV